MTYRGDFDAGAAYRDDPATDTVSVTVEPGVIRFIPSGTKFDAGKPRMDLVPPEPIEAIAKVLTFGADKYGARNWEKGMPWGKVLAAMFRHVYSWMRGERLDPESGYPHLWHALTELMFLVTYEARGVGENDVYTHPYAD